jgi:hypothetical protein
VYGSSYADPDEDNVTFEYNGVFSSKNWDGVVEAETCDVCDNLIVWVDDGVRKDRKEYKKPVQCSGELVTPTDAVLAAAGTSASPAAMASASGRRQIGATTYNALTAASKTSQRITSSACTPTCATTAAAATAATV